MPMLWSRVGCKCVRVPVRKYPSCMINQSLSQYCQRAIGSSLLGRCFAAHNDDAVSTGSGSDRVSIHATVKFAKTITRSLPLPVLTSSLNSIRVGALDDLNVPKTD
jgi:hypothetical protein